MGKLLPRYSSVTEFNLFFFFLVTTYTIFENTEKHQAETQSRSQTPVDGEVSFTQEIPGYQLT